MYRWKRWFTELYSLSGWAGWLLCGGVWLLITAASLAASRGAPYSVETIWLLGMGGVSPLGALDLMGLFRWFAGVFPAVVFSLLYFHKERTGRLLYVLPRLSSWGRWWRRTMGTILVWCYLYAWCGLLILSAGYWLFPSPVAVEATGMLQALPFLLFVYPAGLAMTSISTAVVGILANQTASVFFFVLVFGLTAVIGSRLTVFSPVLPGCFAMLNQVGKTSYWRWGAFLIMAGVLLLLFLIGKPLMRLCAERAKSC